MTITRILASFVVKNDELQNYQNNLIDLQEFAVLDNGTVQFRYYKYRTEMYCTETIDTLAFGKIFGIDVNKLL